tara:strand:+ start:3789 stop:4154 length:366 start_codon:yes stop_codon:yes gene_type:complete
MKNFSASKRPILAGLLCLSLCSTPFSRVVASESDIDRQQELRYLLKQDCGSCHGMRLKGGLGPPLLPETLRGKPDGYLKQVISKGIPGSAMPPWENLLSDNDIDYLVQLLSTQPQSTSGIQ